ncbi:MAG: aminotransferase class IV, partial [Bacteroidia bacterium]|nr:aminotransferase class IV [Bacteroidia bacterium]
ANLAGVDAAIMLDHHGFVAELNATNLFMVRNGKLWTPYANACLHGITRGLMLELAHENGLETEEANLSLTEFYTADEVFCTGTMGELTPVYEIDGRIVRNEGHLPVLELLNKAFRQIIPQYCTPIRV